MSDSFETIKKVRAAPAGRLAIVPKVAKHGPTGVTAFLPYESKQRTPANRGLPLTQETARLETQGARPTRMSVALSSMLGWSQLPLSVFLDDVGVLDIVILAIGQLAALPAVTRAQHPHLFL